MSNAEDIMQTPTQSNGVLEEDDQLRVTTKRKFNVNLPQNKREERDDQDYNSNSNQKSSFIEQVGNFHEILSGSKTDHAQ